MTVVLLLLSTSIGKACLILVLKQICSKGICSKIVESPNQIEWTCKSALQFTRIVVLLQLSEGNIGLAIPEAMYRAQRRALHSGAFTVQARDLCAMTIQCHYTCI